MNVSARKTLFLPIYILSGLSIIGLHFRVFHAEETTLLGKRRFESASKTANRVLFLLFGVLSFVEFFIYTLEQIVLIRTGVMYFVYFL